jgi:hypothetical protein
MAGRGTPPLFSDDPIDYSPHYPLLNRRREPLSGEPPPPVFSEPQYVYSGFPTGVEETTVEETTTSPGDTPPAYVPPPKSRTGLIVGIIVGLVLLAVVGFLVYYFLIRKSTSTSTGTGTGGTGAPVLNESCSAANPCAPIFTCVSNVCKSNVSGPCQQTSDCSQASTTLVCSGTVANPGQCRIPNGTGCSAGTDCLSGYCSAGGTCSACTADPQCQTNQHCVSGACQ